MVNSKAQYYQPFPGWICTNEPLVKPTSESETKVISYKTSGDLFKASEKSDDIEKLMRPIPYIFK